MTRKAQRIPGLFAAAILLVLLAACDVVPAQPQSPSEQSSRNTPARAEGQTGGGEVAGARAARQGANPAALVYQRNQTSVVTVSSAAAVGRGGQAVEVPQGVGSGFVIDDRGHIITNNHVVEDADQLTVTFSDPQRTVFPATLVGRDPDNDLAVIRVDPSATSSSGQVARTLIRPVALGNSDQLTIGEDAIAVGAPLGLQQTVTSGIVSALRQPGEEVAGDLNLLGGAVQTDAAINPGNSGGPLFNADGEVIGVNTAILSRTGTSIGLGFAIPVNVVKRVAPELIQNGCYRHPMIGVSTIALSQISPVALRQLGISPDQKGLLVQESQAGAAQAGIQPGNRTASIGGTPLRVGGDLIVAVDDHPVTAGGELRAYIENNKRPGDTVVVKVQRGDNQRDVQVRLSEKPSEAC
jgi:S1-C subfamily serine protease